MSTRQALQKVLDELPEEKLQALLDHAEFLRWAKDWNESAAANFAGCYEPDEVSRGEGGETP